MHTSSRLWHAIGSPSRHGSFQAAARKSRLNACVSHSPPSIAARKVGASPSIPSGISYTPQPNSFLYSTPTFISANHSNRRVSAAHSAWARSSASWMYLLAMAMHSSISVCLLNMAHARADTYFLRSVMLAPIPLPPLDAFCFRQANLHS